MARLSLYLLGSFQALLGVEPITGFESDKVRALLTFLTVEADRPHRRQSLAGMLWSAWPEAGARRNLSRALSNLRNAIGDRDASPPYLLITHDTIQWNIASDSWTDVQTFRVRTDVLPDDRLDSRYLQRALDQIRNEHNIVGVSAALVVHGQLVWRGVSGNSFPGAPIASDMYFDIGSAAKNFVAALILKLSEEGLLGLEDPISRWLPSYNYVDGRVTIRQLLGHTSGISNFTANQSFWDAVFRSPSRRWLPEEVLSYIGPADFPPGASWNYSNTNYTLLGMIAERAAGCSLSTALRRRLLDPLGLTNTFLEAEEAVPGTIAHGWFDMNGDGRYDDISGIDRTSQTTATWGAGGIVSTAADVARWSCALFEGKVLSAASLSQMLAFRDASVPPTPIVGYGLGALRAFFSGREYWGHGGDMIGYTAIMLYAPKEKVSIAVLFNQDFVDYVVGPPLLDAMVNAIQP